MMEQRRVSYLIPFEQLNRGNGRSTAFRVPGVTRKASSMPTKEQRRNRRGGPDSFETHEVLLSSSKIKSITSI